MGGFVVRLPIVGQFLVAVDKLGNLFTRLRHKRGLSKYTSPLECANSIFHQVGTCCNECVCKLINILVQQVQEIAFRVVLFSISVFLVVCIFLYICIKSWRGLVHGKYKSFGSFKETDLHIYGFPPSHPILDYISPF